MELFIGLILLMLAVYWSMNRVDKKLINKKIEETKMKTPELTAPKNNVDIITAFFQKHNMRYWLSEDQKTFRVGFDVGEEGNFEIFINVDNNYLIFNCAVLEDIKDEVVANTLDIVARINQFYNLGFLNFYFESRVVAFKNVYLLFENELTENKFKLYFDSTIDGARSCRPLVKRVAINGEEPVIAMMSIGNNN